MAERPIGRSPAALAAAPENVGSARGPARQEPYAPLSLPAMFAASVAAAPDAPLIDFFGRRYSYAQVASEADAFAAGLAALGIGKGDRVGLFLPNAPLYLSAYYGTLIAGATVVNYAPVWDAEQLARALAETTPRLVVTLDLEPTIGVVAAARQHAPFETLVVGSLAQQMPLLAGLGRRIARRARQTMPGSVLKLREFLTGAPVPAAEIDPLTDVAVIQYTSGTTGHPKAARLSHQNLTANARQLEAIDPWHGKRDVMIGVLPLAGIFANSAVLNRTVLDRGCIALLLRFDAREVLRTIARTRATAIPGIPTMFQALLEEPALKTADLGSLRVCISGGAPLPATIKEQFEAASGANLIEGYGLVEAAGVVSVNPFVEPQHSGTVGRPLPGTRWMLLDQDDPARPVAAGALGELAVAGPQVMLGYWNDADADSKAFTGDWLRTGDLATIDDEGFARIIDRRADVITVSGERIYPSTIEALLNGHEAVRDAVVIGIPDAFRGESPKAFVTLREDTLDSGESLRNWLNGRLAPKERVLTIEIRDSLPRVAVGKLDRRTLRAEEAARIAGFSSPG